MWNGTDVSSLAQILWWLIDVPHHALTLHAVSSRSVYLHRELWREIVLAWLARNLKSSIYVVLLAYLTWSFRMAATGKLGEFSHGQVGYTSFCFFPSSSRLARIALYLDAKQLKVLPHGSGKHATRCPSVPFPLNFFCEVNIRYFIMIHYCNYEYCDAASVEAMVRTGWGLSPRKIQHLLPSTGFSGSTQEKQSKIPGTLKRIWTPLSSTPFVPVPGRLEPAASAPAEPADSADPEEPTK